jgi:hypothetical protein
MYTPPVLDFEPQSIGVELAIATELGVLDTATPASAAWPTANLAIFVPYYLRAGITARQIYWSNGATVTALTSVECAVYDESGTNKLITSGVVTQAGTSVPQAVTITNGLYLPRGRYWIGLVCGNNTSTFLRYTNGAAVTAMQKLLGTSEQTLGGTALPAAITFGSPVNAYIPVIGLTQSSLAM